MLLHFFTFPRRHRLSEFSRHDLFHFEVAVSYRFRGSVIWGCHSRRKKKEKQIYGEEMENLPVRVWIFFIIELLGVNKCQSRSVGWTGSCDWSRLWLERGVSAVTHDHIQDALLGQVVVRRRAWWGSRALLILAAALDQTAGWRVCIWENWAGSAVGGGGWCTDYRPRLLHQSRSEVRCFCHFTDVCSVWF